MPNAQVQLYAVLDSPGTCLKALGSGLLRRSYMGLYVAAMGLACSFVTPFTAYQLVVFFGAQIPIAMQLATCHPTARLKVERGQVRAIGAYMNSNVMVPGYG